MMGIALYASAGAGLSLAIKIIDWHRSYSSHSYYYFTDTRKNRSVRGVRLLFKCSENVCFYKSYHRGSSYKQPSNIGEGLWIVSHALVKGRGGGLMQNLTSTPILVLFINLFVKDWIHC